jgi:hypothetical protein
VTDDLDDAERMALAIKAFPDWYQERERVECHCSDARHLLHAVYVGPGGDLWLWVAGGRGPVNHPSESSTDGPVQAEPFRPRALPIPATAGEVAWSAIAQCPRCKTSQLLTPRTGGVNLVNLGQPTYGRVVDE